APRADPGPVAPARDAPAPAYPPPAAAPRGQVDGPPPALPAHPRVSPASAGSSIHYHSRGGPQSAVDTQLNRAGRWKPICERFAAGAAASPPREKTSAEKV